MDKNLYKILLNKTSYFFKKKKLTKSKTNKKTKIKKYFVYLFI